MPFTYPYSQPLMADQENMRWLRRRGRSGRLGDPASSIFGREQIRPIRGFWFPSCSRFVGFGVMGLTGGGSSSRSSRRGRSCQQWSSRCVGFGVRPVADPASDPKHWNPSWSSLITKKAMIGHSVTWHNNISWTPHFDRNLEAPPTGDERVVWSLCIKSCFNLF